jgi:hypothetical protein
MRNDVAPETLVVGAGVQEVAAPIYGAVSRTSEVQVVGVVLQLVQNAEGEDAVDVPTGDVTSAACAVESSADRAPTPTEQTQANSEEWYGRLTALADDAQVSLTAGRTNYSQEECSAAIRKADLAQVSLTAGRTNYSQEECSAAIRKADLAIKEAQVTQDLHTEASALRIKASAQGKIGEFIEDQEEGLRCYKNVEDSVSRWIALAETLNDVGRQADAHYIQAKVRSDIARISPEGQKREVYELARISAELALNHATVAGDRRKEMKICHMLALFCSSTGSRVPLDDQRQFYVDADNFAQRAIEIAGEINDSSTEERVIEMQLDIQRRIRGVDIKSHGGRRDRRA